MTNRPRCKIGTRRCFVNKQCFSKTRTRSGKCNTGSRKCYNQKCYKYKKSGKSRRRFYKKYGTTRYIR